MDSTTLTKPLVAHNIFPYLIEYEDGTVERLAGTQRIPSGFDPQNDVVSEDVTLVPETGLSARVYRPTATNEKLPLVVYFHGGAFMIASPAEPLYHGFCSAVAGAAKAVVVSMDYRLAPEHPLPTAFDDAWAAIQWVAAHADTTTGDGGPQQGWFKGVDFERVFLVGDSAGATLAHHLACRVGSLGPDHNNQVIRIQGIGLIHPYFWGKEPIGSECTDPMRKSMVDKWWGYVCPSDKGSDDPLINPFVDGAPSLDMVACERVLVLVAEKDILRDRGRLYYDAMVKKGKVVAEFFETLGEDHVFFIFNPDGEKAKDLVMKLASFINFQERENSTA